MGGRHVTELLGAWALDALEHDERTVVDRHLRRCAACRGEAGRLVEAAGRLGAAAAADPPARLRTRVLAALPAHRLRRSQ